MKYNWKINTTKNKNNMNEQKPFLSIGVKDWIKAFWIFLLSTVTSVVGDAIIQAFSRDGYSFSNIHWKEIGGAILLAIITYLQKQLLSNSECKFMTKENGDSAIKLNKTTLMIIGFLILSSIAFADSIVRPPFDSTKLANHIVTGVNTTLGAIPSVNPIFDAIKYVVIGLGGVITGWCIRHFRKK